MWVGMLGTFPSEVHTPAQKVAVCVGPSPKKQKKEAGCIQSQQQAQAPLSPQEGPRLLSFLFPFSFSVIDIARGKDCLASTNPGYFSCAAFDNPPSVPGGSPQSHSIELFLVCPLPGFRQMFLPGLQAGHSGSIRGCSSGVRKLDWKGCKHPRGAGWDCLRGLHTIGQVWL